MNQTKRLLSISAKIYIPAAALFAIWFAAGDHVLWGISLPQAPAEPSIRAFFRWQLLILPPLLFASEYFSCMKALEVFIRIRVRNDRKLHMSQVVTCVMVSALWGIILTLVGISIDPVESSRKALLLTSLGHIMWMCLYLSLYYISQSVSFALISTLISIACIFYVGELINPKCKFLLTSWAMVSRSQFYNEYGIPAKLALGSCLLVICGLILIINLINRKRSKR